MKLAVILIISLSCGVSGCALVKPYEREYLAKKPMVRDRSAGEDRFDQHRAGAREGADGGTGEPGGGCGCN